ncbi:MAG: YggS family pyridoxal phosphate-dependent enzyme [Chthoniobacterales bacterium]
MQHDIATPSLELVQERIAAAAERSGRESSSIELVVVSKKQSVEEIRKVISCGINLFGESRVQEATIKIPLLPSRLRWHYIGHLQTNKLRKALPLFELFHSIDSLELAETMDRVAATLGLFPKVLLEVNVSGESSKYGFSPVSLQSSLDQLLILPRLQVEGFMTMAPLSSDPETTRPFFASLRKLRDKLASEAGIPLSTLSMGMSNDFEVAIEEGATLVRVGSAIFDR